MISANFFRNTSVKLKKKKLFFFVLKLNTPKFEPFLAKRALVMKNIKIDLFF